jgi:putative membrane protein
MEGQSRKEVSYNRWIYVIAAVLAAAVGVIYVTPKFELEDGALDFLPALNASINASVSVMLLLGYYFIRKGNRKAHQFSMTTALVLSGLFLLSYVLYHTTHESTAFGGEGWVRTVYLMVLLSHIVLAIVIVPLVLIAFTRALSERFDKHRRIARFAFPLWLYVSITGVVVYLMISPYY